MKIYTFLLMSFVLISSYSCTDEDVFLESYTGNNDDDNGSGNGGTIVKKYEYDFTNVHYQTVNFDTTGKIESFEITRGGGTTPIISYYKEIYTRNSSGIVTQVNYVFFAGPQTPKLSKVVFGYDNNNNINTVTYTDEDNTIYNYTATNSTAEIKVMDGATEVSSVLFNSDNTVNKISDNLNEFWFQFTYTNGNVTNIEDMLTNNISYLYDNKPNPIKSLNVSTYKPVIVARSLLLFNAASFCALNEFVDTRLIYSSNNCTSHIENIEFSTFNYTYNANNYPLQSNITYAGLQTENLSTYTYY